MQVFIPYKLIRQYYDNKSCTAMQLAMVDFTQLQFYFEEYLAGQSVMTLTRQVVKDTLKDIRDSRGCLRYHADRTMDEPDLNVVINYLLPALVDIINTSIREYLNYWFIENKHNGVVVHLIGTVKGENLALTRSLSDT